MARFDLFVVFADMRTGSNFLEANLNALPGIRCHGEAFNPHFIGYPKRDQILGIDRTARDADPGALLAALRAAPDTLDGFRYFHDHDPRILDDLLADPRCAKIVLNRNPLESYVSWKIARQTGQWKLTDMSRRKAARAAFDGAEFERHVSGLQDFQLRILHALQVTGQSAFWLDYEDLKRLDVVNGLAAWLGSEARLEALDDTLKRQNPAPLEAKVADPAALEKELARIDRFHLSRTPNLEPRRGPAVPSFVAAPETPLLYMPLRGGPEAEVARWLAALDGAPPEALEANFTQKELRQWMRAHPGHRRFTVLRHPLARAHAVFCARILSTGEGAFRRIRRHLLRQRGLPLPEALPDPRYDAAAHRAAFEGFLDFVKDNLAGLTNLRTDPHWTSQAQLLHDMSAFALPDLVVREEEMAAWLPALAAAAGREVASAPDGAPGDTPFTLRDIHDTGLDAKARQVYARDFRQFGFADWRPAAVTRPVRAGPR
ncbi:nodulation protein NodH [Rhodosalinus sp. K401]|uniref:nodulation protein NodH n=1 Tax=Rhodosalinus sp. K401 TaxID=3239195 RepID=UPI003526B012